LPESGQSRRKFNSRTFFQAGCLNILPLLAAKFSIHKQSL
jgi:hypothetical protein